MKLDADKIDAAVLALLLLGRHDGDRAWKGFDWNAMNRLHEKGFKYSQRIPLDLGANLAIGWFET